MSSMIQREQEFKGSNTLYRKTRVGDPKPALPVISWRGI